MALTNSLSTLTLDSESEHRSVRSDSDCCPSPTTISSDTSSFLETTTSFLSLPAEIRNMVYAAYYENMEFRCGDRSIIYRPLRSPYHIPDLNPHIDSLRLVSKLIRTEAEPLRFPHARFTFASHDAIDELRRIAGSDRFSQIRRVSIEYDSMNVLFENPPPRASSQIENIPLVPSLHSMANIQWLGLTFIDNESAADKLVDHGYCDLILLQDDGWHVRISRASVQKDQEGEAENPRPSAHGFHFDLQPREECPEGSRFTATTGQVTGGTIRLEYIMKATCHSND